MAAEAAAPAGSSSEQAPQQSTKKSSRYQPPPPNDTRFSSDHFMMFGFKLQECRKKSHHDWKLCPFAHPGEKARRRSSGLYPAMCPDAGNCPRGEACSMAHSAFEFYLCPQRYRTELCHHGTACTRRWCWFAHTPEQLRTPGQAASTAASTDSNSPNNSSAGGQLFGAVATNMPLSQLQPPPPPPPPPRTSSGRLAAGVGGPADMQPLLSGELLQLLQQQQQQQQAPDVTAALLQAVMQAGQAPASAQVSMPQLQHHHQGSQLGPDNTAAMLAVLLAEMQAAPAQQPACTQLDAATTMALLSQGWGMPPAEHAGGGASGAASVQPLPPVMLPACGTNMPATTAPGMFSSFTDQEQLHAALASLLQGQQGSLSSSARPDFRACSQVAGSSWQAGVQLPGSTHQLAPPLLQYGSTPASHALGRTSADPVLSAADVAVLQRLQDLSFLSSEL